MMQYRFGRRVPAILAASVVVLLAGCASRPAAQTADDAVCRQEANNDPQVKASLIEWMWHGRNPTVFDFSNSSALDDARYAYRQALQACMVRRGLSSGGVEPVRQYPFSSLGF